MIATPKTLAQQVRTAQVAREARAFAQSQGSRLAFTSETGVVRPKPAPEVVETWEEFCFICSRATDHVGEHNEVEGVEYDTRTVEFLNEELNVLFIEHTSYVR